MFLSRLYSPLSWGNVYGLVLGYKEPLSLHKDISMGASISNVPTMSDKLSQFVARSSRFFCRYIADKNRHLADNFNKTSRKFIFSANLTLLDLRYINLSNIHYLLIKLYVDMIIMPLDHS